MTPINKLPILPEIKVTSTTFSQGQVLGTDQLSGIFGVPNGKDVSPQLSWSGAPENTQSYAITAYDPDAPTGSGFWHWAVFDIPSSVTALPENAGAPNSPLLPPEAITLPNDAGIKAFLGAAPPAGHGPHHYIFTVHAVDCKHLDISPDATPAILGFNLFSHAIARGSITGIYAQIS